VFVRCAVADHQGRRICTGGSAVGAEPFESEAVAGGTRDDVEFDLTRPRLGEWSSGCRCC
jgi:hypothetical protein